MDVQDFSYDFGKYSSECWRCIYENLSTGAPHDQDLAKAVCDARRTYLSRLSGFETALTAVVCCRSGCLWSATQPVRCSPPQSRTRGTPTSFPGSRRSLRGVNDFWARRDSPWGHSMRSGPQEGQTSDAVRRRRPRQDRRTPGAQRPGRRLCATGREVRGRTGSAADAGDRLAEDRSGRGAARSAQDSVDADSGQAARGGPRP
jgi:hypothetical protein